MNNRILITRTNLIDIFSKNSITIIESDASILIKKFRVREFNLLFQVEGYRDYYHRIRKLKDDIEYIDETYETHYEQLLECLDLLRNKRDRHHEEVIITKNLIQKSLYQNWNTEIKEVFDQGCKMILEWKDFFLSYTNRNSVDTNDDFQEMIKGGLGETLFYENKENSNCLAKLIVVYLKQNRLTYFFDKYTMKCGDELEDKIFHYCDSAFSFVQLVEHAVFDDDGGKKNWCFMEYNAFLKSIQEKQLDICKRIFFFITNEKVFPPDEGRYASWIETIKKHVHVGNISELDKKTLRSKIDDLAIKVYAIRNTILDNYFQKIEEKIYS